MKFIIASDLHGSYKYAKLLFERMEAEKADRLLLLGDLLYHGARNDLPEEYDTKALFALLNTHKDRILCVRGNCDSEVDQMVLEFPIQADYLTLFVDGRTWVATHGHVFDEHSMIPHEKGTVLLHGHTHVKVLTQMGDFYFVNPGSVSLPKDDATHSYMIYEDSTFTIKDMDGKVIRSMRLSGT